MISSVVASPGCSGSMNYGVQATMVYQVLDKTTPTGKPIQLAGMTPYESGVWFGGSTLASQPLSAAIGTKSLLCECQNLPFAKNLTATQKYRFYSTECTVRYRQTAGAKATPLGRTALGTEPSPTITM